MEVEDGRGLAAALDREGFCLVKHGMGEAFATSQEAFDAKLAAVLARACDFDAALNDCLRAADLERGHRGRMPRRGLHVRERARPSRSSDV